MRQIIDHRVRYRFTEPQGRLVQLLRMTPENTHDQTVAAWDLTVDRDAKTTAHRDGFGNCATMLYCEGPLDSITIDVHGEVVTSHSNGVVVGASDPLPPPLFLRTTPVTVADEAIEQFAQDHATGGDAVERMHRLTSAVKAHFSIDRARPTDTPPAGAVFSRAKASPRDMAHVLIAAARHLDIPARYVSGYYDADGNERPTAHGWADAWIEGLGWVGFDPTIGESPEDRHVRVANGLDATFAAFVAGSRLGEGDEELDVEVTIQRED